MKKILIGLLAIVMLATGIIVGRYYTIKTAYLIECSDYHTAIGYGPNLDMYYDADWN